MSFLQNGDPFPHLEMPALGGGTLSLPGFATGAFSVIVAYRGAWCPFCAMQLTGYVSEKAALDDLGVRVAAFSVDDEPTTKDFAAKLGLNFPVGHNASADQVGKVLGALINENPRHLQPTAFILTPKSEVLASVYASHAVGRLLASDVVKLVSFVKSRMDS
jgi:peroxiredoxin